MKAVQMRHFGSPPELVEVPRPVAREGQVLLRVLAAGLCHTDLGLMDLPPETFKWELPFAPGHEIVGEVVETGAGVDSVAINERVVVYGAWGCGECVRCAAGEENYCVGRGFAVLRPGLGGPGGIAEYMLVDNPRHLVPLGDLDPVAAVGLTDAGLTSHHAVCAELDRLVPGTTAFVIGVGGVGHMILQVLRALTSTRIIATDLVPEKRELAAELGADHVLVGDANGLTEALSELTNGSGVDVVFDMVGSSSSLDIARAVVRPGGSISIVGGGGGALDFGPGRLPHGVRASVPFWGTLADLCDVLELARRGDIAVHTQTYRLDQVLDAYRDLAEGRVIGRAVVVP